jgi:cadmium resistance transport/sequestration family protein
MLGLIIAGVATFAATNIDDILILVVFFSQVNTSFRPRHVVMGQYLGFAGLVGVSLLGFFGGLVIPRPWIGLLGLAPIVMGVHKLLNRKERVEPIGAENRASRASRPAILTHFLNPQTYAVAVVTIANGGDNIGIYTPLFAASSPAELSVLLGVFFALVGVWCFVGYRLTHRPGVATLMTHYGHVVVPLVLIGLGVFILLESGTLALFG